MIKSLVIVITLLLLHIQEVNAKQRGTSKVDGLYSEILSEQRELLIQLPNSYQLTDNLDYPVLYLLDGQRNFNHASGTLDLLEQSHMAQEMIIVAIKNTQRTLNFTPSYDESYNRWGKSGGADAFLDFMQRELMPYINQHYRTTGFNVVSGHSLGGLLVVYSLQTRPKLFQAHFAFSPSLWWHGNRVVNSARDFYRNTQALPNYLYINMGNEGGQMLSAYEEYTRLLQSHSVKDFNYNSDLVPHENHNTTAMVGHNQAYRYLFDTLRPPAEISAKGLAAIEEYYAKQSKEYGVQIVPDYPALRQSSYAAYHSNQLTEAIERFKTTVKRFPHLSDAHYRLALLLDEAGHHQQALQLTHQALVLSQRENAENNSYKHLRDHLLVVLDNKAQQAAN